MGSNPVWCTIFLFRAVDDSREAASKARLVRALLFLLPTLFLNNARPAGAIGGYDGRDGGVSDKPSFFTAFHPAG